MMHHYDASYLIQTTRGPQSIAASYDDKRGMWVVTLPGHEIWLYPVADTPNNADLDDIDGLFDAPTVWQAEATINGYSIGLTIGAGATGPLTADIVATAVAHQMAQHIDITGVLGGAHD